MKFIHLTPLVVVLLSVFISFIAQANLLISPTRIAFNDRDRIHTVTLINSGKKTNSYRIEWVEQKVNKQGSYEVLTEQELTDFPIASPYIRHTPRQVTLEPGERQVIKLLARRANDMQNGEYRSHLTFTALPDTRQEETSQGLSMQLNLLMSYSIPILLRKGELNAVAEIADIQLKTNPNKPMTDIFVTLSKRGTTSLTGSLKAYYTAQGQNNEIHIGTLNGFNFFSESQMLTKQIIWVDQPIDLSAGVLRIAYEGAKEFAGQTLAEKRVAVQ